MKKSSIIKIILASLFCCFILSSCYEDYTHFYEDPQKPGLSIFSDKANNIMTCYINGVVWRTYDRTNGYREVYIQRIVTTDTADQLKITWEGRLTQNNVNYSDVGLILSVPKNFMYKDFNSLEGKRLIIDKVKNYFSYSGSKGSGNIYFHFAHLDSIQTDYYRGRMSGLFDADLGSIKITNGRFDHDILPEQVHF